MAFKEFVDSRERIARAHTHRKVLAETWADFSGGEYYSAHVKVQDDGTGTIWVSPPEYFPTVFSLLLGEMLYQLRAALDACVYGAAIRDAGQDPPANAEHLEFPICASREEFKKSPRKIRPLSEKRRTIIETVQPYNAPNIGPEERVTNVLLGLLNDLARRDRHRCLHVMGSWTSDARPRLRIPPEVRLAHLLIYSEVFLEDESEVASFRLDGWKPGMKIQANPDLSIDIALNEPLPAPFTNSYALNDWCDPMIQAVEHIIARISGA